MVEFVDGCVIAQLACRHGLPIHYALTYPERLPMPGRRALDLARVGALTFERARPRQRSRACGLARSALEPAARRPAVLNAANEVAVAAFLAAGRFLDIPG